MALVAVAMVAIIAMAALSIDAITLYLANAEAQRAADSAALAGARVISLSGITGTAAVSLQALYWKQICGPSGAATQTAQAVAKQNTVGGVAATATVSYSPQPGLLVNDCSSLLSGLFPVNPVVVVKVQRPDLPTFFARIWGKTGSSVSATAAAEVFNPSNSGSLIPSGTVPVHPRCVKPWLVPNLDPLVLGNSLVSLAGGSILNPGISLNGLGIGGIIGETFTLAPDCHRHPATCQLRSQPGLNGIGPLPNLQYVPGQTLYPSTAVPACSQNGNLYEQAIEGCDQTTVYQCGVRNTNVVDLSENPGFFSRDSSNGVQCLTGGNGNGQDTLNTTVYPFQIQAGASNPLVSAGVVSPGSVITSSNSIVTVPIYDSTTPINPAGTTPVTIVGFMQVFINSVDSNDGNVNVTVLNLAGCSNTLTTTNVPVVGTSPLPVRLVTPP